MVDIKRNYMIYLGKCRTEQELDDYFMFDFFKRSGGGIGVTRLIRSMRMEGLIPKEDKTMGNSVNMEA